MKRPNDGGSAFPMPGTFDGEVLYDDRQEGMSLRDWFAGQALIGLLAYQGGGEEQMEAEFAAEEAYEYADAMIKAREGKQS